LDFDFRGLFLLTCKGTIFMGFCLCSVVKFETLNLSYKLRVLNHSDWTCALLIDRWNSWNFFACNINETVIKETGKTFFLLIASNNKKLLTCFI
jgi:hypothetical protein